MCIIIGIPGDKPLPTDEILQHCWEQNPHWGGFAFVNNKKRIVISKFDKCDDLIAGLKAAKKQTRSPIIVHMRWATHGKVGFDNTHPFRISDNMVFAHNGTIHPCTKESTEEKSDTRVFRDKILRGVGEGVLDFKKNKGLYPLLKRYIGKSKLAFLNTLGELWIINEEKGEWVDGLWFSNDYYKTKRAVRKAGDYQCTRCNETSWTKLPTLLVVDEDKTKGIHITCCYSCRTEIAEMLNLPFRHNLWKCEFCQVQDYTTRSAGKEFYRLAELPSEVVGCCEKCFKVLYGDTLTIMKVKTKGKANTAKFNTKLHALLKIKLGKGGK